MQMLSTALFTPRKSMPTKTLKLYGSGVASANAVAQITVPRNCQITSIKWSASGLAAAAIDGRLAYELSTVSVGQFATNDAQNVISQTILATTVASSATHSEDVHVGLAIPLAANDRLYLHAQVTGSAFSNAQITCLVSVAY